MTTHKWQKETAKKLQKKADQTRKFADERLPKDVRKFFLNPYWMHEYESAPNERLRQWQFWCFEFSYWDESMSHGKRHNLRAIRAMKALEAEFSKADWQYLIDHTPNITARIHIARRMKQAPD
ncbi:MAG TPA: hypothetical protein DEO49_04635 [Sutterella sp.]|nr:hypothetical protein [Sutterella sp.]